MKTKVTFRFDNIDALIAFNREFYIKGKFHKKQWAIPTQMKESNGYAIEYCVGVVAARKLRKMREEFALKDELMYKNIKIESLV